MTSLRIADRTFASRLLTGTGKYASAAALRAVLDASGAEVVTVAEATAQDARDAVVAARKAFGGWSSRTAYNRGQVVYRIAEMLEARRSEFAELCTGPEEVERSIDRLVWYAGWADKLPQVLGSSNPVNVVMATIRCLERLRSSETIAETRGVSFGRKPATTEAAS